MYCTHYNQFFNADWLTYKLFTVSCLSATYTVLFISFDHHSYTLSSFIRLNYLIKYSQSRRNLHIVHVYYKGMRGSRWRNQGRDSNPPPPGKIIKNMPRTPLPPKKNISHIPHPLERILKRIRKYSNCDYKIEQIYMLVSPLPLQSLH